MMVANMNTNLLFEEHKYLINEADVLLFNPPRFLSVGWFISKYTHSPYSHAALAHWEDGELYVLEFREFKGSRKYLFADYIENGASINVFRSVDAVTYPVLKEGKIFHEKHEFTPEVAHQVTQTALDLMGKHYSYWTIWQMIKTYIPFIRLRTRLVKNGEPDPKRFVCSTLVTYAFRKNFIDPIPFLSDGYTSPGDLARSGLFSYLFTIK